MRVSWGNERSVASAATHARCAGVRPEKKRACPSTPIPVFAPRSKPLARRMRREDDKVGYFFFQPTNSQNRLSSSSFMNTVCSGPG